jgi:Zn-dependent protease with chaperone function
MRELTARADLPSVPALYYVPSKMMNAFAVGKPEDSAVAVTDGLIRNLNLRQITGVLAHEVSHIRNGDLKVMALGDTLSRLTGSISTFGLLLGLPAALHNRRRRIRLGRTGVHRGAPDHWRLAAARRCRAPANMTPTLTPPA